MRQSLILVAAITTLALAGCASSKYEKDPMYDAGFGDGCATGTARAQGGPPSTPVRDEQDWENSDAYRAGWKSGYSACSPNSRSDTYGTSSDPRGNY